MIFGRNVGHLTFPYIAARLREISYQRRNKDLPWLTQAANQFLGNYLLASDVGLEFGSGRSTLWFAKHVKRVVSVEHDYNWYKLVKDRLHQEGINNVDYRFLNADTHNDEQMAVATRAITNQLEMDSFDFVLVDGVCRDVCAREAIRLLRPGGILVIDNVNRHLPSNSASPESRSYELGPDGMVWGEVLSHLASWRHYWTSSGVTDTAIYFKPGCVNAHRLALGGG